MLKNYFKVAYRNIIRNFPYSGINILCLALGIACCMTIFMWVFDELRHDKFHKNSDLIHRTVWDAQFGDNNWKTPLGPVPVGSLLQNEFPEVEHVTQLRQDRQTLLQQNEYVIENNLLFTDENFFKVFSVDFIAGNFETALEDPNSVVLTQESAKRYFPNGKALDSELELNNDTRLRVTGIVREFPAQSHFDFDFLASIQSHSIYQNRREQWSSSTVFTYFTLQQNASEMELEQKLNSYLETHINTGTSQASENYSRFIIQPLSDIYLGDNLLYDISKAGSKVYVYLFLIIGIFILLLACINYINLATAYATRRAREVAVRKANGALRGQLSAQFLAESGLSVIIALLLGALAIEFSLPYLNDISGKNLSFFTFGIVEVLSIFSALTILIILLSGAYPAFLLASFDPVKAFKGIDTSGSRSILRNCLVIFQFCTAAILITGTLTIYSQLHLFQNKDLGFNSEQVLVVENAWALEQRKNLFIQQLTAQPEILHASGAQSVPGRSFDSMVFEPEQPANYNSTSMTTNLVDPGYARVLDLEFLKGRNFSEKLAADSNAFILNETAVNALGWKKDPIGREISALGGQVKGPVIGVVKDHHYQSLHHRIEPIIYMLPQWSSQYIAVRISSGNIRDGLKTVQKFWEELVPEQPFKYAFLDEALDRQYTQEERVATIFNTFSILALIIASLGLFGLTAYMAERRKKEIGVRKVLGATIPQIVGLLTKDFLKLILLGFLIAVPISWYGMNQWLANFEYRIDPGFNMFLISGGIAVVIALLTISWQAVKAAMANPVDSLRSE